MKYGKRILAVLMVVVLLVCAVPVAIGAEIVASGGCGQYGDNYGYDVTWLLDSEGLLTISGTGYMNDIWTENLHYVPWRNYRSRVKSVIIQNGVKNIGQNAFRDCINLTNVTIPNSVKCISYRAFQGCSSLANLSIPDSVTQISDCAFNDCTALTHLTIPSGVKSISPGLFEYCSNLTSVTIPDDVTSIRYQAFYGCTNLASITLPNRITTIGRFTFGGCTSLTRLTIPDNVTNIEEYGFYNCRNLKSISISDSMTSIETSAFWGCSSLTDVYYNGTETQWNRISIGSNNEPLTNATIHFNSGGSTGGTTAETSTEFNTEHGKASVSLDIRDLEESAYDFNYYIARFAVNMSLLTYSPRGEISGCLSRLGFNFKGFPSKDTDEKDYCYWPDKKNSVYDKNCFVISRKDYVINGENKTLVLVMMRGTNGNEWYSNFNPGEGDTHASFDAGAKFVLNHLKNYMRSEGLLNKDNVKMIITGHSRGAAVANLLGKYINLDGANGTQKFGFPEEDNVFTYTFATPNVTSNPEATSNLFKTIFNFVNPEDFVTKVMPSKWKYKRYGVTLTLPSKTNEYYYNVFRENMNVQYRQYKGKSYSPYSDGEATVYNLISKMTRKINSVNGFYHDRLYYRNFLKREPYLFFKEELCPLVAQTGSKLEITTSATSLVYTWTSVRSDDLYFSLINFFFSNQLLGALSNALETIVNKIIGEEVDVLNPLFEEAHCAETYAAFINTMTYDQMYTMGLERKGRYGSVNCPVDVEIIDKETNEVVGRIVDNVVDEEILAKDNSVVMTVDGDEKSFWLPSNGDYEVKLIGNDEGTMDYTLAEIDSDAGELGRTNFFDVQLEDGLTYTGELPAEDFVLEEHTLTCEDGTELQPDEIFDAENAEEYTVTVNVEGNGTVEGAGTYTSGDYMTLTAIPDEYHVFAGWFVDGELTDEEAQIYGRLPAGTDITATAKFVPHPHTYTSAITTAPFCETPGVRTFTCECGDSYTETIPALGHTDDGNDGYCDRCGEMMTGDDHCPQCGKIHNEPLIGWLIGLFHRIIYRLTHLFQPAQ